MPKLLVVDKSPNYDLIFIARVSDVLTQNKIPLISMNLTSALFSLKIC